MLFECVLQPLDSNSSALLFPHFCVQGMGQRVERMQRAIKYGAILGGSEEIMGDLGVKMAMKGFPKTASKL